jgi:hypothetical protein
MDVALPPRRRRRAYQLRGLRGDGEHGRAPRGARLHGDGDARALRRPSSASPTPRVSSPRGTARLESAPERTCKSPLSPSGQKGEVRGASRPAGPREGPRVFKGSPPTRRRSETREGRTPEKPANRMPRRSSSSSRRRSGRCRTRA